MYWEESNVPDSDWRRLNLGERRNLSRHIRRLVGWLRSDVYWDTYRGSPYGGFPGTPPTTYTVANSEIFGAGNPMAPDPYIVYSVC